MRTPAVAILVLVLAIAPALMARERFVATDGQPVNPGTFDSPWDLKTALQTSARPGDIVWLRGGTYRGPFVCRVSGVPGQPIIFRQYRGEHARIDSGATQSPGITIAANYVWLWGFEIFSSSGTRKSVQRTSFPTDIRLGSEITIPKDDSLQTGNGVKVINMVLHDDFGSFFPSTARETELYGNIIYHEGWDAPDRGHGHGLYVQNRPGVGTKHILDNVMFGNFSWGLHVYAESDVMHNFEVKGNVAFDNGALSATSGYAGNFMIGGSTHAPQNVTFENNYSYYSPRHAGGYSGWLGGLDGCADMTIAENYLIAEKGTALRELCGRLTLVKNVFFGALQGFANIPGNAYYSQKPTAPTVFVRTNAYEAKRATIVVYNWNGDDSVSVDVSSVLHPGDVFEVRDVQNYFGDPVQKGVFNGTRLKLPMTLSVVSLPVGDVPKLAQHTDSGFGTFILVATAGPVRSTSRSKSDAAAKTTTALHNPAKRSVEQRKPSATQHRFRNLLAHFVLMKYCAAAA